MPGEAACVLVFLWKVKDVDQDLACGIGDHLGLGVQEVKNTSTKVNLGLQSLQCWTPY